MTIGIGAEPGQTVVTQTDTAELLATVRGPDNVPASQGDLASVMFTIKLPDDTQHVEAGAIQADGSGFLRFEDTVQLGVYQWTAQFTFNSGEKRTYRDQFTVTDPFVDQPVTQAHEIAEEVWMRLEECFDSELGGPWLRERTLAYFDPSKVARFIPEGLLWVNSWPPATDLVLTDFTTPHPNTDPALPADSTQPDPNRIIIVQATLLAVIRHLMRGYVEQPAVAGANIVYQDRRDYQQRWQAIYQIEEDFLKQLVTLWKRQFYNFGKGAMLIHSKAGRLTPAGWRTRNAARGIGY
jgi:hypothetical protein